MFARRFSGALPGAIPVLATALLAGGCAQPMTATGVGDVDEMPLLVRFAQNPQQQWCPMEVIQMVESCDKSKGGVDPEQGLVCRGLDKKINWVAVKAGSSTYVRDMTLPEFEIRFKVEGNDPTKAKSGGKCKDSQSGVLECKIDKRARSGEYYEYGVHAGDCGLDPRIYVH